MSPWTTVYLGLGSDMGDREANLRQALSMLAGGAGVRNVRASAFRRTRPADMAFSGHFLNAAARLETTLTPRGLLARIRRIETALGRGLRPGRRGLPRPIDLDILLFGPLRVNEPDLVIPHPRMHRRPFVTGPLRELAPELFPLRR